MGLALIGLGFDAGQSMPREVTRFQATVNEVLVPLTVTNHEGEAVGDLRVPELRLSEDGESQTIDSLLDQSNPLSLGIVADVSGSMDEKIDSVRMVLSRLFDHLASDDRAFLGGFNDDFHLVQSLTDDRSALDAAIARLEPFGDTALYDAVVEGLERLNRSNGRRALILISDGLDNCSQSTARRAVDIAKTAGIRIYAVGIGERTRHRNLYSVLFPRARRAPSRGIDENRLRELAESTGGRLISVSDTKARPDLDESLRSAFGRLSRELRMMYVLAYRPARQEFDGRWRHIRVEITRPNLVVRFREGYFAVRPAH